MQRILIAAVLSVAGAGQALAGATNSVVFVAPVPTLDEIGLTALTIVVGIAGGIVARRRKKK